MSDATGGMRGGGVAAPVIVAVCTLAAAGLDGLQLSRPGYLLGSTADISVYLGAAVRLVHGALPYRDFVLVQPPGIALLLSPAALLSDVIGTRSALAMVRLGTILIAAVNVLLVGRLVRHRGALQTLVACGVMALYPAELYALNNGLLEPVVALFCLLGAAAVVDGGSWSASPRRWLLGGAAMGLAAAIKIPAVLPALVLAAMCLPDPRRRLLPFVAGVIAGFAIPSLAFFAAAPGSFVRDVVLSQLSRVPAASRAPVPDRIAGMTVAGGGTAALVATVVLLAVIVIGFTVRGRQRAPVERFAIISAVLVAAAQFVPAQYYPQYAAFLAPFLAIALGAAADRLAASPRRRALGLIVVAVILPVLLGARVAAVEASSVSDPAVAVDAVVPPGGCTVSDGPRVLIPSDRFVSAVPDCTAMVDPFGTMLTYAGDPSAGIAVFQAALAHADYLVLSSSAGSWLSGPYVPLRSYVAGDFHLVRSGWVWIYVRNGYPIAGQSGLQWGMGSSAP
jgi:hypothetical protein